MNSFPNSKRVEIAPLPAATAEPGPLPFPVLMVDPSLFTAPYDEALVEALRAQGQEVMLLGRAPRAGEPPVRVPFRPAFYRRFDGAPRRWGPAGQALKGMEHLIGGLRLARARAMPALLHFQWLPFPLADAIVLRLAARSGPVVVTVHDTVPFNGVPTSPLQRLGVAAALRAAGRLIVHTESGRARLTAAGLDGRRIRVIPHGPLAGAGAARRGGGDGRWTVVAFGRMRPYKGLDLLVDAVARLAPPARAELRVIVAGEPMMDLAPLRAATSAAGLAQSVELRPGRLDDAGMAELFQEADAFVFPHREVEASGVFFLVQGLGRWVIASRIGAFAEALEDGASGRLVPPGDAARLAEALAEGVRRRPRPSAMPRTADWQTIASATLATYAEAGREWAHSRGSRREVRVP
jgi:glycosyltransferase involved in cell wall biosynthesis